MFCVYSIRESEVDFLSLDNWVQIEFRLLCSPSCGIRFEPNCLIRVGESCWPWLLGVCADLSGQLWVQGLHKGVTLPFQAVGSAC